MYLTFLFLLMNKYLSIFVNVKLYYKRKLDWNSLFQDRNIFFDEGI